MLRLVERVLGEGEIHRQGAVVLRAGYELALYRHWTPQGGQLTPGHFDVEGYVMASPEALDPVLGTSAVLTLHLDDGRRFDCFVLNHEGAVTSADARGLYRP